MSLRFQRLLLIILSIIFLGSAILLILFNSKKNMIFFYTPSELIISNLKINDTVRIGGFVKNNSLKIYENNQYEFNLTDNKSILNIKYTGLLPDLFKEGQGAVIEGKLIKYNVIKAYTVFAKHDENYMPESIKKELKNTNYWEKKY